MKKSFMVLFTLVGLLILTSSAWCDPITSATYGTVDDLIAFEAVNSGDANELAWVNSKTGMSYIEMVKYVPGAWQQTADAGILAIDFTTVDPAYFFVKLGNIAPGLKDPDSVVPDHFLYKNMSSLAWGVINMAEIETEVEMFLSEYYEADINIDSILVGKISHTGEVGGGTEVPEPATLILLGLGLLGIAGIRRKK